MLLESTTIYDHQFLGTLSRTRLFHDWMESGMESDVSENLEPDEMYLMLQADMLSIKRQENALQSEIVEVTSKFKQLLQTCGLESEISINNNMTNTEPTTPSFMHTRSLTRVSNLSGSSDEDYLLQQMMKGPLCSLVSSTSSDSIYEDSAMTLIIDDNSNYKPSQPDDTGVSVPNIELPSITELSSSSDISNGSPASSTSDGYPKSSETSSDDNQCVPDCMDLEQELLSRMHYYSDFTIDRQRKINDMTASLCANNNNNNNDDRATDISSATEELFTREVEGCEDKDNIQPRVRIGPVIGACLPSDSQCVVYSSTDCSTPSTSGRRRRHRTSRNRTGSSQGSRKSSSNPVASSTMIEELSPSSASSGSSRKSSSIPCASSTMIEDPDLPRSKPSSSNEDLQSIYTWSIVDEEVSADISLEESYFRNFNGHHKLIAKPPLPSKKIMPFSYSSSSNSSTSKKDNTSRQQCRVFLGDSCAMPMDALSVIEPSASYRDTYLTDSMYDDEAAERSSTLPRTSTRLNLLGNKSSGSSSMEARRASLPDILSVCTPHDDDVDFQSVPSSEHSSEDSSPLQERLELPGKSSSSSNHTSPNADAEAQALADAILTDSPHSICSSGIYVPCNTPNVTDHSKSSHSTTSNKSESQPIPVAPVPSAPKPQSKVSHGFFKIPKNNQPLRNLFKFKRSKGKSTDKIFSSTPSHVVYPSSVRSDPISKRKLFSAAAHSHTEEVTILDKKAVMKKFKRFSATFNKRDKTGLTRIQTLANL